MGIINKDDDLENYLFGGIEKSSNQIDGKGRKKILQNQVVNKMEGGFDVLGGLSSIGKGLFSTAGAIGEGLGSLYAGAFSAPQKIIGNVLGGISDIGGDVVQKIGNSFLGQNITDEQATSLGDFFRENGLKNEEEILGFLKTDPESFLAKTGAFGMEVASLLTPAGVSKSAGLMSKIKEGAKLGAKAELVSEGEITPEGVIVGAGVGLTLGIGGKVLNKINPKTQKELEKKLSSDMRGLYKLSPKAGQSTATIKMEKKAIIDGAKELQKINPSFKISEKSNSLKEVGNVISKSKSSIVAEMKGVREGADRASINTKILYKKLKELPNNDVKFKALIREGGGEKEYKRIMDTLKDGDEFTNRNMDEIYEAIIEFNSKGGSVFSSTKDNIIAKVNSAASKIYNKEMDKSIGKLGPAYRELNKSYSKIRKFEDVVASKYKSELSKNQGSTLGNLSDSYLDSSIIFNAFTNPALAAQAATVKGFRSYFSSLINPNNKIFSIMNNIRKLQGLDVPKIGVEGGQLIRQGIKAGTILQTEKITK